MPWNFRIAIGAVLLVSVAGAITALGDTLFPSRTLADGMRDDFSAQANFLIRLRVIHPVLAVLSALYLAALAFPRLKEDRLLAGSLLALLGAQLTAGAANVLLQAPLAMQLLHLLIADALWVALILLANRPRVSAVN
jgi:heme A synthase